MEERKQETATECQNCKYFIPLDDEVGHCVRYAPHPIGAHQRPNDQVYYATWPHVMSDYRCGEFQPKEADTRLA